MDKDTEGSWTRKKVCGHRIKKVIGIPINQKNDEKFFYKLIITCLGLNNILS